LQGCGFQWWLGWRIRLNLTTLLTLQEIFFSMQVEK
jgi:hypothetical protein